jgi:hypothetical protein
MVVVLVGSIPAIGPETNPPTMAPASMMETTTCYNTTDQTPEPCDRYDTTYFLIVVQVKLFTQKQQSSRDNTDIVSKVEATNQVRQPASQCLLALAWLLVVGCRTQ